MFHDLKFALRSWRKSPGFVVVALATLALGIGANVVIFSMLNVVMLKPLPYPDPDRIVQLWETNPDGRRNSLAYPNFKDWQAQAKSFSQIEGIARFPRVLTGVERPAHLVGRAASAGYFDLMGVKPILGRTFTSEEDRPGSAVVLLQHATWQTHFGGDPAVIGKTIRLDTESFTIIGVLPANFTFWNGSDAFYVPLGYLDADSVYRDRSNHGPLQAFARLKPGVTVQKAEAELKTIAAQLAKAYPIVNTGRGATIAPLRESRFGRMNETMLALFGAVAVVLLIACANVANLLLARATSRRMEISIRAALGASRWQITRQMLVESLLLAVAGGCLGLALAVWGLDAVKLVLPGSYNALRDARIDSAVLAFCLAVSLLTGTLFGLAPAWHAIRDLGEGLKAGGRSATGGRNRTKQALLVAEIALAVVVSVGAGLLVRSLIRILNEDPGFRMPGLLTAQIPLDEKRYREEASRIAFYEKLLNRLHSLPGVESASTILCLPIDGACWGSIFIIGGRPIPPRNELPESGWNIAGLDYFRVMDIKLLKGRTFLPSDKANAPLVAVISETVARRFFPNEDPIGKRIKQSYPEHPTPWREIVGIVADIKQNGLEEKEPIPMIYLPYTQESSSRTFLVARTQTPPETLYSGVRDVLREIDPDTPVHDLRTIEDRVDANLTSRRFTMGLILGFAGLALAMAAFGVFSVIAYSVSQRTREIGVRVALGAQHGDVVSMVLGEGVRAAVLGIGVGLVLSLWATRLIESMLFGIQRYDFVSFGIVALLLVLTCLAACYLPARRAAAVDPMVALRYE